MLVRVWPPHYITICTQLHASAAAVAVTDDSPRSSDWCLVLPAVTELPLRAAHAVDCAAAAAAASLPL
jgi:hypothetical protein